MKAKPTGTCATGKVRFRDEIDAKIALSGSPVKPRDEREKRAYPCHACRGWHLTSKP